MKRFIAVLAAASFTIAGCASRGTSVIANGPSTAPSVITATTTARLDSTLRAFVDAGAVAGISSLVWAKDREAYSNAFGMADREANRPMARDAIVQIFSMTKPSRAWH